MIIRICIMNSSLRKTHNDVKAYGTGKSIYYRRLSFAGITSVIDGILAQHRFAYQALIYQLTAKQKQVLIAIAQEGKPSSLMSQEFLQKYHLGASTVQGAVKTLLDRDFITQDDGVFQLCDKFLELSLRG